MAHIASHSDTYAHTPWSAITRILAKIGHALVAMGETSSRLNHVNALEALSDEELAERGIKRANIVQHVYRDILWL